MVDWSSRLSKITVRKKIFQTDKNFESITLSKSRGIWFDRNLLAGMIN